MFELMDSGLCPARGLFLPCGGGLGIGDAIRSLGPPSAGECICGRYTGSIVARRKKGISHCCSRWLKEGLGASSGWPRIYGHLGSREDMVPSVGFGDLDRLDSILRASGFSSSAFPDMCWV